MMERRKRDLLCIFMEFAAFSELEEYRGLREKLKVSISDQTKMDDGGRELGDS